MAKPGRAWIIDPKNRQVFEAHYEGTNQSIYRMGGYECFSIIRLNLEGDTVYVDENGLLYKDSLDFFGLEGYAQPLQGNGVVLGTIETEEGNDAGPVVCDRSWILDRLWWVKTFGIGHPCLMQKALMNPVTQEYERQALRWRDACALLAERGERRRVQGAK